MINDLMKVLQSSGKESVIDNPAVPNQHNEGVLQQAGNSILETLKGMMAKGQTAEVQQLASDPGHPAVQQMENGFVQNIMQKFGISGDAAKGIAATLIPKVLAMLGKGGSSGGLNLSSITGALGKMGMDKDKDGDVDISDVKKMFGF